MRVIKLIESLMFRYLAFLAMVACCGAVNAQTAPSAAEIESYSGLQIAAHEGRADDITRLIGNGADPNVRDRAERTPAHIAAFAAQDDALKALAEGGADMNALENRLYDIVTIAAVANDPELVSLAMVDQITPRPSKFLLRPAQTRPLLIGLGQPRLSMLHRVAIPTS